MANYYSNSEVLNIGGYEIYFTRYADSIIKDHFTGAVNEITDVLEAFNIPEEDVVASGGGLSKITQRLGNLLRESRWIKENIESIHSVGGKILTSESHEVDHYKRFETGNLGLEIEWNNKDPFFDRDLENFRKLHQIGELSLGIIITRGTSLQEELYWVIHRFLESLGTLTVSTIQDNLRLSDEAKNKIANLIQRSPSDLIERVTQQIYSSKFGTSTTHMDKLKLRLDRGVGNPCPLILIGIGREKLVRRNEEIR